MSQTPIPQYLDRAIVDEIVELIRRAMAHQQARESKAVTVLCGDPWKD